MKRARDYFAFSAAILLLGSAVGSEVFLSRGGEAVRARQSAMHTRGSHAMADSQSRQERVIHLPEDGENWYLTLFYRDRQRDAASVRLARMFNGNARLNHLMQQVHLNKFQPGDPLYQTRYAAVFGGPESLPAVVLQQPDGRVCYKASGQNIPQGADLLADEMARAIADCWPRPQPEPAPSPAPLPTPNRVPDLRPRQTVAPPTDGNTLLMVLIPLLAGGLGIYQEWKQST